MHNNTENQQRWSQLQGWMQSVITHPGGVLQGMGTGAAQNHLAVSEADIESVILPSQALSSVERLEIYARAYYGRLLECLRAEFPILAEAMGPELFDEFAIGYLQQFPSRSYTLNVLGTEFAKFLRDTRPRSTGDRATGDRATGDKATGDRSTEDHSADEEELGWPDFLIDLATLEWTFSEVFDGPGVEGRALLSSATLAGIPPETWGDRRLMMVPCLKRLKLDFRVHDYYTAIREKRQAPLPERAETLLAVTRRNFVVRYLDLTRAENELLGALMAGATLSGAIEQAAPFFDTQGPDIAAQLHVIFRRFTVEGFFSGVE